MYKLPHAQLPQWIKNGIIELLSITIRFSFYSLYKIILTNEETKNQGHLSSAFECSSPESPQTHSCPLDWVSWTVTYTETEGNTCNTAQRERDMPLTWTDKFKCPGMGVGSLCSSEAKRNTSPPLAPLSAPKKKISMWQRTLVSSLQHGNLVQCFFTYCPARLSFPFLPIPIPSLGNFTDLTLEHVLAEANELRRHRGTELVLWSPHTGSRSSRKGVQFCRWNVHTTAVRTSLLMMMVLGASHEKIGSQG